MFEKIDRAQQEIMRLRPLKKIERESLQQYLKIKFIYTSNAIEGNSLTETETKIVIEDGITIGGKQLKEHFEVIGHAQAYDFMQTLVKKKTFSEKDICELHRLFYFHIDVSRAGIYRKEHVFISGTDFVPPTPRQVPILMKKFAASLPKIRKQCHPVEFAAQAHFDFVVIHPFVDGNGRCARLLMNLSLLQEGYPITMIPPILRREYMSAIRGSEEKKSQKPFISFIAEMVHESQREYLRLMRSAQQG